MDSTSLLLHLLAKGCRVRALSFDYGQKHKLELECVRRNLELLKSKKQAVEWDLIDVSAIGNLFHSALLNDEWEVPTGHYEKEQMKATVVPNRNAIFASIAYGYALSLATKANAPAALALGVHRGDHAIYPDCRPVFYEALQRAFELGNWDSDQVLFHLPYLEWDKAMILQEAKQSCDKLALEFNEIFSNTLTSYSPDPSGVSSGITGSDVERILAFDKLGIEDPIRYQEPWPQVVQRARELEKEYRESNSN